MMKLRSVQHGMKELASIVWITLLRKVQNMNRAGMFILSEDKSYDAIKINPVFYWRDTDTEYYLKQNGLCRMNEIISTQRRG